MARAMQSIKNGNKNSPPELDEDVVKVVVVGEPRVGKSTFIHAFCSHHEPGNIDSHNAVRWFPCEFNGGGHHYRAAIFEIPGGPEFFPTQRNPHYTDAKVIVFMYAIDDPSSLDMIYNKWYPEVEGEIKEKIPMVLVGNKKDLRNDQQMIDRLALNGQKPVEEEQGKNLRAHFQMEDFTEISANNLEEVNQTFDLIFSFIWDAE